MRFSDYGKTYPDLAWVIWEFFSDHTIKNMLINDWECRGFNPDYAPKCVADFLHKFDKQYTEIDGQRGVGIQPRTIAKICDKLCEHGILRAVAVSGINNFDNIMNFYESGLAGSRDEIFKQKNILSRRMNNLIYGFAYIYESNRVNVRPIWVKKDGALSNGTCFNSAYGIVTAMHCLEGCSEIQIEGIEADVLKSAKIYGKDKIDLVLIIPQCDYQWNDKFMPDNCEVLDEIMVMGYPNHSGFDRFLTTTVGSVAAIEQSYLVEYKQMLLTGKIKGGNSGGPVVDINGSVVGIVTEHPSAKGDYDNFGYGIAIPSSYLTELEEINNNFNFTDKISDI